MQIKIAEKLKPYSHTPGDFCLLPGTFFRVQVFPALLRIHDLRGPFPTLFAEIPLPITGPVKDFTILQNLEQGFILVWGLAQNGFMRYKISGSVDTIFISIEKGPEALFQTFPNSTPVVNPSLQERLSLGNHKAQDWGLMNRRIALEEILPLWFRLGQMIPSASKKPLAGTAILLDECKQAIETPSILSILSAFQKLFLAGFEGMLSPRLQDENHQGFNLPPIEQDSQLSPLILLTEGALLIRSLFVQQEKKCLKILPALPPEFHCGRFLGIQCHELGILDMEWSKKAIRRMVFQATQDGELALEFFQVKSYRLRMGRQGREKQGVVGESIKIQQGQQYLLDNFMR
jgi:hypothetical protein